MPVLLLSLSTPETFVVPEPMRTRMRALPSCDRLTVFVRLSTAPPVSTLFR